MVLSPSPFSLVGSCDDPCLALFISGLSQHPSGPPPPVFTSGSPVAVFASLSLQGRGGTLQANLSSQVLTAWGLMEYFPQIRRMEKGLLAGAGEPPARPISLLWPRPR